MRVFLTAGLLSLAACAFDPAGPGEPGPSDTDPQETVDGGGDVTPTPTGPTVACRVERANLGVVGLTVTTTGQGSYRFDAWETAPTGKPIGFTLSGPDGVRYEVRTHDERFLSTTLIWTQPEPDPIERVEFCSPDVEIDD